MPSHVVQAIARHADIDVTLTIYAHTNLDAMPKRPTPSAGRRHEGAVLQDCYIRILGRDPTDLSLQVSRGRGGGI